MAWYRKASDLGKARATTYVGNLYYTGSGVPQDYVEAIAWYGKAAEAGDPQGLYNMAALNDDGHGVERNGTVAAEWMIKALAAGYESARTQMQEKAAAWSDDFRISLQTRLKDLGVYSGPVDGNVGPTTLKAIDAIFAKG